MGQEEASCRVGLGWRPRPGEIAGLEVARGTWGAAGPERRPLKGPVG